VKDSTSLEQALERIILLSHEQRIAMGRESRRLMEREFAVEKVIRQYDSYIAAL
jgi:hypothetical protein